MESGKWLKDYRNIPADILREKEEQVSVFITKSK